jgi:hypothetical protein
MGAARSLPYTAAGQQSLLFETPAAGDLAISKIHTGAADVDGGPVTITNPFDVALSDGTNRLGTSAHPLIVQSPLGQATMANSRPVALASDQTTLPTFVVPSASPGWTTQAHNSVGTAGVVVKSSAGRLRSLRLNYNGTGGTIYVMVFNKATAPVNGDTAIWISGSIVSATYGASAFDFADGLTLNTGISFGLCTGTPTSMTLTLPATGASFLTSVSI